MTPDADRPQPLDNLVTAVAGVGGGLGPVVVERLAAAGAIVAGCDRDAETAARVGADLGLGEDRYDGRGDNLLDPDGAAVWRDAIVERFGRVDALIHLVGGWRGGTPLAEAPLADWDLLHDLLIRTVQHTTRAFHTDLVGSGRGRFVLVSARQAQEPSDDNAAYAAAKAAAEAWTLALADGFTGTGATANIVVVEAILTPAMRAENPDEEYPTFTPAEQLAETIAYLCGEGAAKMNGQRLRLIGG